MPTNVNPVVDPNTPVVPAGTGEGAVVPEGTPATGSVDAAEVQRLRDQLAQAEQDRRKQQALLDRQLALQKQEHEKQLAQYQEQLKGKMTDAEKAAFEQQQALARAQEIERQYQALQQQLENQKVTSEWVGFFSETFGINPKDIDTSSQESMIATGMAAVAAEYERLKGNPPTNQSKPPVPTRPAPGPTLTGNGQPPATTRTIFDIQKQMTTNLGRQVDLEEVFRMAERGEVDLNQLS